MQEKPNSAYDKLCRFSDFLYKILNVICVTGLWTELFAVTVMVTGRYVFNKVPTWCDQLSTTALIWTSVISIAIALYDESHMRVELIDKVLSEKAINALKYFSNVAIAVFSVLMTKYGFTLTKLTWKTKMSGFHVSTGVMYIPLIICGIMSVYFSLFCIVRRIKEAKK